MFSLFVLYIIDWNDNIIHVVDLNIVLVTTVKCIGLLQIIDFNDIVHIVGHFTKFGKLTTTNYSPQRILG